MHKGHERGYGAANLRSWFLRPRSRFIALALGVFVLAAGSAPWLSPPIDERSGQSSDQPFIDGFRGESLDFTSWNTCYWWGCTIASNKELQWYERSQVRVADGVLSLTAEAAPVESPNGGWFRYRSGMISSGPSKRGKPRFAFTYGTVEARLRVPAGKGLWSALWMLPAFGDNRPEVDIVEVLGNDTRESHHFLHRRNPNSKSFKHTEQGADLADGWHVYRLEWLPGMLRWYLDSELIFTVKGDEVPDDPMYVMANLAVGGRWPGPPNNSTQFPAVLLIDYIEIRPMAR
jgi:beta-glucanase (GH16 family)